MSVVCQERSGDAIVQRYKKVRAEALRFESCLRSIKSAKPTGDPTAADLERAATAVLNGVADVRDMYSYFGDKGKDPGKAFPFPAPLAYLRTTSQWQLMQAAQPPEGVTLGGNHGSSVTAGTSASGSDDLSAEVSPSKLERPVGAKRAHMTADLSKALSREAEGIEALAAAANKRARTTEKLYELEKMKAHLQLFEMPGTDLSLRQELVQRMQRDVLRELNTPTTAASATPTEETEESLP